MRSAVVELLECVAGLPRVRNLADASVAADTVGTAPVLTGVRQTLVYISAAGVPFVPPRAVTYESVDTVGTVCPVQTRPETVVYVRIAAPAAVPGETLTGV